jgi:hypothetical protein
MSWIPAILVDPVVTVTTMTMASPQAATAFAGNSLALYSQVFLEGRKGRRARLRNPAQNEAVEPRRILEPRGRIRRKRNRQHIKGSCRGCLSHHHSHSRTRSVAVELPQRCGSTP